MRALLWTVLLLGVLVALNSCMDPEPGEISVRCFKEGRQQSCVVMLFSAADKQIDEQATDRAGLYFFKNLPPATYKLKFKDSQNVMYPAEATVKVGAADSEIVDVQLEKAPEAAPDAAPSS